MDNLFLDYPFKYNKLYFNLPNCSEQEHVHLIEVCLWGNLEQYVSRGRGLSSNYLVYWCLDKWYVFETCLDNLWGSN